MVDLAKVIMQFFRFECCGKCTPCRIGTQRLYEIVCQISEGKASLDELEVLQKISENHVGGVQLRPGTDRLTWRCWIS